MMTKKDYEKIAHGLADVRHVLELRAFDIDPEQEGKEKTTPEYKTFELCVHEVTRAMETTNPNFDSLKFRQACLTW
jgi:hypothetical protein